MKNITKDFLEKNTKKRKIEKNIIRQKSNIKKRTKKTIN